MGNLISIIVPVYNVESYLEQCIDSILNQTYKNLEVILVDDGSTDRSGEICDRYAEQDSRIRVVHKTNGGLSSARNAGLKICHGDYLGFIDSDDYIDLDMYKVLLNNLLREDADISACEFYWTYRDHTEKSGNEDAYFIFPGKEAAKSIFVCSKAFCVGVKRVVWNKLYKRSVFFPEKGDNIIFPEKKFGEDNYVTPVVLYHARRVVYSGRNLYFYRQREGSLVHSFGKNIVTGCRDYYKWTAGEASDLREDIEYFILIEFNLLVKKYIESESYPLWINELNQLNNEIVHQTKTVFGNRNITARGLRLYFLMKFHLLIKQRLARFYFKNLRTWISQKNK